jgi:hypothetical protein
MTRWLAVPVAAVLLLAATGCARTSLTGDDYASAYLRYAACLEEAGTPLIERDLTGPVYDYSVPISAAYLGTDAWCYEDFREIDEEWRKAQRSASAED